ncbi:MAG: mannitol dehydrogenase family protein [Rhizobacter sp.]
MELVKRLTPESLGALPVDVAFPGYDRKQLLAGIVHLGIGAFVRAHLAAVNEAAILQTGDLRFGIVGVSMRSTETRDALAPQSGLYSLALRDVSAQGERRERLQVIGHLIEVMVAPENPGAVVERIAHEHTRIVSLTVTEKGYCHDPASGALLLTHADIVHDLAHAGSPRSAIGMLVRGLDRRRQDGKGPLALMSLDNLPSNGKLLRALVLEFAGLVDAGLRAWIEAGCSFPNSMVDRIVPRTTAADIDGISSRLGLRDAWPVVAEPYLEWAVEDRFVAERPRWDLAGARFVASAEAFERLKLRMVNATHSALAYLAASAGVATADAAMAMPFMREFLQRLVDEEIAPSLGHMPGVDLKAFGQQMLVRFSNPALAHKTQQIAMDGSQKLPQRLLGTVRERLAQGLPIRLLALAVAGWVRYLDGADEAGRPYAIQDPLAQQLAQAVADPVLVVHSRGAQHHRVAALLSFAPVFGDLGQSPSFVDAVSVWAELLKQRGVVATLAMTRAEHRPV